MRVFAELLWFFALLSLLLNVSLLILGVLLDLIRVSVFDVV